MFYYNKIFFIRPIYSTIKHGIQKEWEKDIVHNILNKTVQHNPNFNVLHHKPSKTHKGLVIKIDVMGDNENNLWEIPSGK
jgi:hypothetical protein